MIKKVYLIILVLFIISTLFAQFRDSWQQPEKIMNVIGVKPGMTIGEIGAGDGYFTFKLSKRVGEDGEIYANDIVDSELEEIRDRCKREGISNISTIVGELTDPKFPDEKMDMLIMVYVFHDLDKPVEFLQNTRKYLKPGVNLVIIDRDPDKYGGEYDHFLTKDQVIKKIEKADYQVVKIETFLSRDNIYICRPN